MYLTDKRFSVANLPARDHSCFLRTTIYVRGKFTNFNELYNVNEFCVLQNEILISRKILQSHITYYSCKNLPSIVRELPRVKE